MSHVDDGTLHALVDDALDATERAAVEAHLASCGECARRFAEATALTRQTLSLLSMLDESPAASRPVRIEPAAPVARPTVTRTTHSVFTLRRVALAASLALVAGLSYEVGKQRDTGASLAVAPSTTRAPATVKAATPAMTVVEASPDSFVAAPTPPVRLRAPSGPRAEAEVAIAERADASPSRGGAPVIAPMMVPAPVSAAPQPTGVAVQQRAAGASVAQAAPGQRAQDAAEARGRAADAAPPTEQMVGQLATQATSQGAREVADLPAARKATSMAAAAPTANAAPAPAAPASPVASLAGGVVARKAAPLPGYSTVEEESQAARTRLRYLSSAGTPLTLLIVPAPAEAKPQRRAEKPSPEFVVSTRNGISAVRWRARGMQYELTGALTPDSLVKLATQLK